ncbi:MAG: hypothetical protein QM785_14315 [Pyrinomonadaceae bacterium]
MEPDLREIAIESALELERLSARFPANEPGRKWLQSTATRLKNGYARTRKQQKILILQRIGDGCRKVTEIVDELGYTRHEVELLLSQLKADDYVHEHLERQIGQSRGRPFLWYDLTDKGEHFICSE